MTLTCHVIVNFLLLEVQNRCRVLDVEGLGQGRRRPSGRFDFDSFEAQRSREAVVGAAFTGDCATL